MLGSGVVVGRGSRVAVHCRGAPTSRVTGRRPTLLLASTTKHWISSFRIWNMVLTDHIAGNDQLQTATMVTAMSQGEFLFTHILERH